LRKKLQTSDEMKTCKRLQIGIPNNGHQWIGRVFSCESLWLPNLGYVVLDLTWKTFVELMTKSRVVPIQLR